MNCYRCDKPQRLCLCARMPRVDNRTGVFVLQHPRERAHPIGTARFAQLGLSNVRLEVAWNAGARETEPPAWLPEGTALLYPATDARDLHDLRADEKPRNLLVIDGTWHTARTLYRDKAWLHALPHVRFSPSSPSRYRLRREPHHDYVSTIEAIVEALRVLEPEAQNLDALLETFDAMIDEQLTHIQDRGGRPRLRRKRARCERRTPRALVGNIAELIVAYAESSRPGLQGERELVQLTASALGSGQTFQCVIRPTFGMPDAQLLAYMQLDADDFAKAGDVEAFRQEWQSFLHATGSSPVLAAWNQSTLDMLAKATSSAPSQLSLKGAYRSVYGATAKNLDEALATLGLVAAPNDFHGRAAQRLAGALAIARHLHERAQAGDSADGYEAIARTDGVF